MELREASRGPIREGIRRGKGIACAVKDGGGTRKAAHASVRIAVNGSVLVLCGSVEIGQGVQTLVRQIAAEELTLPPDKIAVGQVDTAYTPFDQGTNASSATTLMGRAVLQAAQDARNQLLSGLAAMTGEPVRNLKLESGSVVIGTRHMVFTEAVRLCLADTGGEILGRGFVQLPVVKEAPLGSPSPFWEIGLGACEVEVDEKTGSVKLLRYVSLTDAGKMIHPLQCEGQDEGAAVFGMGQALFEEMLYEGGQLLNPNLIDYRLPRFGDVPAEFETIILEEGGGSGPYGAKGMGEGGILAVAPAVCNAVFNATGVRIDEVPIRNEKLLKAIRARRDLAPKPTL